METVLFSAFGLGLAGAGHCLGMCGGIAAALNLGHRQSALTTVAYHGGRVCSYTALGAALGVAAGAVDIAPWTLFLRYLAGFLLIGMGLYIADLWRGMSKLEQLGGYLWQPIQRMSGKLLPIERWYQALALGLCWGLMPCGLIYSSLALAATQQGAADSALFMLCFGLGTLPAMLATSLGANRLQGFLRQRGLKLLIALLLICSGVWTVYLTVAHGSHLQTGGGEDHSGHHMEHVAD